MRRIVVLALLAASCARGAGSGTWEGSFLTGFEVSSFVPCSDPGAAWWLYDDTGDVWEAAGGIEESNPGGYVSLYLRVEGEITEEGEYGHLGAYDREITVKRLLEARSLAPDEPAC